MAAAQAEDLDADVSAADDLPVGREAECRRIEAFLDGDRPGALLLEGELGIGKSTLLRWGCRRAAGAGCTVLPTQAAELELDWEYSSWADLLDGVDPHLIDELPAPLRRAAEVAVLQRRPPDGLVEIRAVASAMLAILRRLCATAPVLVTIDDLQWLDPASRLVLASVLRRARDLPLALLATSRTSSIGDDRVGGPLAVNGRPAESVTVGPLDREAIGTIAQQWAARPLTRGQQAWLHRMSAGNPLFAFELVDEMEIVGWRDTEQPRGPRVMREFARRRMGLLSRGARDLLVLAALSDDLSSARLFAAAADSANVLVDLDEVIEAGILVRRGHRLEFDHPLTRATMTQLATAAERRSAHRRLAAVHPNPEARARHRGLGADGADEAVAQEVEQAAHVASMRGALHEAAVLAELSVDLTPPGDLPARVRRTCLQVENLYQGGATERSSELLRDLLAMLPPGTSRIEVRRRLARYAAFGGEPLEHWIAHLTEELDEIGADDALRADVAFDIATAAANAGQVELAFHYADLVDSLCSATGDRQLSAQMAGAQAFFRFTLGQGLRRDLCERALEVEQPRAVPVERRPGNNVAYALHASDQLDEARVLFETELALAIEDGRASALPNIVWGLAEAEIRAGNWTRAGELLEKGWDIAEEAGIQPGLVLIGGIRALLSILTGDVDGGLAAAEEAIGLAMASGFAFGALVCCQSVGLAGLSRDDPADTRDRLAPVMSQVIALGLPEPGMCHFFADDIEARVRLGDLEGAESELELLEDRSQALDRRWGLAAAGRCRALLCMAQGKLDGAQHALDSALEQHEQLGMPFELGRTLLVAAEVHRRSRRKRQAADACTAALTIFSELGAPLWREKAAREQQRVGIRSSVSGSGSTPLTKAEEQVARLAMAGMQNAEIAGKLFMSSRTVQAHLSSAYRKLGVRNRTELASRLSL